MYMYRGAAEGYAQRRAPRFCHGVFLKAVSLNREDCKREMLSISIFSDLSLEFQGSKHGYRMYTTTCAPPWQP